MLSPYLSCLTPEVRGIKCRLSPLLQAGSGVQVRAGAGDPTFKEAVFELSTPRRVDPRPPPSLLSTELPPPNGAPPSRSGPRRPARRQHPRRCSSCPQRVRRVPGSHAARTAAPAAGTPHGAHGAAGESRVESGWGRRRAAWQRTPRLRGHAEWTSCAPGKLRGGLVRLGGSGTRGRGAERDGMGTRGCCRACIAPSVFLSHSAGLSSCLHVDVWALALAPVAPYSNWVQSTV